MCQVETDGRQGAIRFEQTHHFQEAGAMLSVIMWVDAGRPCRPEEGNAMFQCLAMDGIEGLLEGDW